MTKGRTQKRRRRLSCLTASQFADAVYAMQHLRGFRDSLIVQQGPVSEASRLAAGVKALDALLAEEVRCDLREEVSDA